MKWHRMEIEILKDYYPGGGVKTCSDKLCRTNASIKWKANELKIFAHGVQGGKKRLVIKHLDDNMAIAFCSEHGEVKHYNKNNRLRCIKCERDGFKKWSSKISSKIKMRNSARARLTKPINVYKNRLRSTLYYCFKGAVGFTKHLPYSRKELCDYLEGIRLEQNNRCPMCQDNYDDVGFDIDHIIPTSSTADSTELLLLFNLDNLSLLCPKCNRWVKRDRILCVNSEVK